MAGPRLSKEKRAELRNEIANGGASKSKLAEMVRSLAAKYGIGKNSVRRHHRRVLKGPRLGKRGRKSVVKIVTVVGRRLGSKAGSRAVSGSGRPPAFRSLVVALREYSPSEFHKAIKASRIQDQHDTLLIRLENLAREVRRVEKRAAALRRKPRRA